MVLFTILSKLHRLFLSNFIAVIYSDISESYSTLESLLDISRDQPQPKPLPQKICAG